MSIPNVPNKQWAEQMISSSGKELDILYTDKSEYTTGVSEMETGLQAGKYYIQIYRPSYGNSEEKPYSFSLNYEQSNYYEQEPNDTAQSATEIYVIMTTMVF
ncbi:hypothetical protein [Bacillus dakarensis]|uniref:hypothetical protein n=1 Tax=Robertmurraya dakarensis TaxID=1926278 RepID=UPI0009809515|nr:hypothetical protein [Bacillus dakarensis]